MKALHGHPSNGTRSTYCGDRKNIQRITVTGDGGINKDGDNGEDLNGKKRHHHCRQKKAGHAVALFLPNVHAACDDRKWVTHQDQGEPQSSWFAQSRATDAKGKQNHKRRRHQHFHTLFLESG